MGESCCGEGYGQDDQVILSHAACTEISPYSHIAWPKVSPVLQNSASLSLLVKQESFL